MKNNDLSYETITQKTDRLSESLTRLNALYNEIKEAKNTLLKKEDLLEKDLVSLAKSALELQQETLSALREVQHKTQSTPEIKKPSPPPVQEKPRQASPAAETVFEVKVPGDSKKKDAKPKTEESFLPEDKKESKRSDDKKEFVFEVKLQTEKKEELKPKTQKIFEFKDEPVFEIKIPNGKKEEAKPKTEEIFEFKDEPVFEIKIPNGKKEEEKPKTEGKTQKTAKNKDEPVFEVKLRTK